MSTQPSPQASNLHKQAAEDYRQHHSPQTQAAAREQSGQARTNGNAAAGAWGGRK
ncbi:hypothetical protein [Streptomyces sp. KR80]|uniref:hypothetical protein n=1 Tax=Streptomyces sp. KR80 TaxID=3457426 RepID=UPI003FD54BD1